MKILKLKDYINEYHGTQRAFAKFINRSCQQVNQMLRQVRPIHVIIDDSGIKFAAVTMQMTHDEALANKIESMSKAS